MSDQSYDDGPVRRLPAFVWRKVSDRVVQTTLALLTVLATVALGCTRVDAAVAKGWDASQMRLGGVLVLPIAASDDYQDERSGVTLHRSTREQVGEAACQWFRHERSRIKSVCYPATESLSPDVEQLMIDFALDQAVAPGLLEKVSRKQGARYLLLVRPNGVSGTSQRKDVPFMVRAESGGTKVAVSPGHVRVETKHTLLGEPSRGGRTRAKVQPPYQQASSTISYWLTMFIVDAKDGSLVWSAQHGGEATASETSWPFGKVEKIPVPEKLPLLRDIVIEALSELPD